jgi:hypothetical protein
MRELFNFYKNKPEWINEFYTSSLATWRENKYLVIYITTLLFVIPCLIFSVLHKTSASAQLNKRNEIILKELNEIKSVLHEVEGNPYNTKEQQQVLKNLEKDFQNAQKSMTDVAKSADIQKVSLEIASVKDDIDSQLHDIKKTISETGSSKEYLNANVLPFHVISVDVIAGQPYVSVEYANHVSPLSIGDELAGWRVVSTDYQSTVSEFINDKNQHIKVSLQGTPNEL